MAEPNTQAAGRRRRVLVIEDNVLAAETLREALQLANCDVEIVHTGSDAIAWAPTFVPDVVLCDIGLPDMDGYEVARRLRADERLRSAVLVALTGHARPEDEQRARDAGFDRHVAKPLSLKKLEQLMVTL